MNRLLKAFLSLYKQLAALGLEAFIEYDDPKAPGLRRMVHETVKMGADNPDNYYQNASISGEYEYRIIGNRGTVNFLGFSTQRGSYGENGGMPPSGFLDSSQLEIDEDGSFEIIVSREEKPENWLPMAEIQKIYRFLDLTLGSDAETNMKSLLKRYVKDRYGLHRYRLDYFDLDPAEIKNMFSDYIERFGIKEEYDE